MDLSEGGRLVPSEGDGPPAAAGGPPPAGPLVNIDTTVQTTPPDTDGQEVERLLAKARTVGGSHRKTAYSLKENVGAIVRAAGVQNLVFFTPTLANQDGSPPDPTRAQDCWRRAEKIIAEEFPGGGVRILERGGKTGRLHYHVMLDVQGDVRTGYDFAASRAQQQANPRAKWVLHASANPQLRSVHDRLYTICKRAGFGRIFHCEPVRSENEAIRTYLSKYICKHVGQRLLADKGRRLVAYFGEGAKRRDVPSANRFAFGGALTQVVNGKRRPDYRNAWAWIWRQKLGQYMSRVHRIRDMADASDRLGTDWAYRLRNDIQAEKLAYYPYLFMAVLDGALSTFEIEDAYGPEEAITDEILLSTDVRMGPSRGYVVGCIRLTSDGVVTYAGKKYNSAEVLAKVAARKPKPAQDGVCTVLWADGRVDHSDFTICEESNIA